MPSNKTAQSRRTRSGDASLPGALHLFVVFVSSRFNLCHNFNQSPGASPKEERMASFNKITIVGHLGRDPEIRYTPQGLAVCNFSVATSEKRKDQTGEQQEITTWFKITFFGRQAEVANQYLTKGKQVYIEGKLRQNEFTGQDGVKRTTLEVTGSDLQFLGSRDDGGGGFSKGSSSSAGSSAPPPQHSDDLGAGPSDSDIPF
jgi:single-strand DNA-binding protein